MKNKIDTKYRIGYGIFDRIRGKFKEVKSINNQIDTLDSMFENCWETALYGESDTKLTDYLRKNMDLFSEYQTHTLYLFNEIKYFHDFGEKEVIKELIKRRDIRIKTLEKIDIIDISTIKSQIREGRLSKILDK